MFYQIQINMKIAAFVFLFLLSSIVIATPIDPVDSVVTGDITPAVAAAIRSGNSSSLAAYFSATIDLAVPGSDGTYSKSQAELIVKGFFDSNPPKAFIIKHQGSSGEGSQFCIGSLETDNANFRTYFLIKTINGASLITQLQFEEE
jgi:hypothetical protein